VRLAQDEDFGTALESAVVNAFVDTNDSLHQSEIDDTMSGTTAITILMKGKDLYVANVGDSRAFIAEVDPENGKMLVAEDLSHDQTPYRPDECERVRRAGATVMTLDQLEGLKDPKLDW
jgi:serine/threonine protein phosphatase PrpC